MKKNLHIYDTTSQEEIDRTLTKLDVEPKEEEQTILPPEGYNGFNEVNIKAAKLQQKIVAPSKEIQIVKADEEYYGLSEVVVSPITIDGEEILEAVESINDILSDSYISGDTVAEDLRAGKVAYSQGKKVKGKVEVYEGTDTIVINDNTPSILYTKGKIMNSNIQILKENEEHSIIKYFKDMLANDTEDYLYKTIYVFSMNSNHISQTLNFKFDVYNYTYNEDYAVKVNGEFVNIEDYTINFTDLNVYQIELFNSHKGINEMFCYITIYTNNDIDLQHIYHNIHSYAGNGRFYLDFCYVIENENSKNVKFINVLGSVFDGNLRLPYRIEMGGNYNRLSYRDIEVDNVSFYPIYFDNDNNTNNVNGQLIFTTVNREIKTMHLKNDNDLGYNKSRFDMYTPYPYHLIADKMESNVIRRIANPTYVADCSTRFKSIINFKYDNFASYFSNMKMCDYTNIRIGDITGNIYLGSITDGTGKNLTRESIIFTLGELIESTTTSHSMVIGAVNLKKIEGMYVKLIDITEEMWEKDNEVYKKKPFVVCEPTDEGAMIVGEYVSSKNWELK